MSFVENIESGNNKYSITGFFNYVFNFDQENKNNIMNLIQYLLIGIIPVIVILKLIKQYVPEEDDTKGTFEISFEVLAQLLAIFFSIWFIDKTIRFIPTYSKVDYHKFNEINFILPFLIILVTMQTKLGAKINILFDRMMELINGKNTSIVNNINKTQVINTPNVHQVSRADTLDNTIIHPPPQQINTGNVSMIDGLPNMINNNGNVSQNQAMGLAFTDSFEPMAANSAISGAFGSSF